MSSAAQCSLFLILTFLMLDFCITAAQSNACLVSTSDAVEVEIQRVSGKDNAQEWKLTMIMKSKIRMLFGLHASTSEAEAAAESPSPLPQFQQLHIYHEAPSPRRRHVPLVQGTMDPDGSTGGRRKLLKVVASITASVMATLALFGIIVVSITVHRRHQRKVGTSNGTSKVSFDPEPEMIYLEPFTPFLETDSDHKPSPESKSLISSCPSPKEELALGYSPSSDGNESFYSVCSSHCSFELASIAFEPNLAETEANVHLSPLTSSRLNSCSVQSIMASKPETRNAAVKEPSDIERAMSDQAPSGHLVGDDTNLSKPLRTLKGMSKQRPTPFLPPPLISNKHGCVPNPPPPPPPPSFPKPNRKTTPAPPSQLQKSQANGKGCNELPKLKPLHWDKVRAASDRSMVWDKIRSSSFELDEQMIESLFGYNKQYSAKGAEFKSKSSSPGKQVLEHKRLQNFTILMKALNATAEQVCNALIQGTGLDTQQLEALAKMVPTMEEEEKLCKYVGDADQLGSIEKFLKVILTVPLAFSRIEAMLYKETFEEEVIHLKKSFAMLEEACKELRSSRHFLRLLEAVLKTGNRMNVGTIRGGATAFKLDALLKLADVKGTDGKTTLLHFVIQEMIKSESLDACDKNKDKLFNKTKTKTAKEAEKRYNSKGLELISS
ncbi:hypothetical protein HPP92_026750 [Vanilla planifolia]|uniref:Formin-like protein n=1 Tax=Vanilla planifolia TaxID=51239 RepID=A0A835U769_VANPL|nr:hypothetical protein HPP92_026750 [Vanilla planifolia]